MSCVTCFWSRWLYHLRVRVRYFWPWEIKVWGIYRDLQSHHYILSCRQFWYPNLNFAYLRIYTTDRWLSINHMPSSVSIIFWCYHLRFFTRFCLLSSFWSKLKTYSNVTNTAMTEDKSINKMRLISVTNAQLSKNLSPGTLSYSRVNRTFFPSQNISAWRQTPLDSSRRDTEVSHQPLRPDNKS